jgi:hypothetical protein
VTRTYRRYDHRLRNLVAQTGSIESFLNIGVPKSTLKSWVKSGPRDYFTLNQFDASKAELALENPRLKSLLEKQEAKSKLVFKTKISQQRCVMCIRVGLKIRPRLSCRGKKERR